MGVLWRRYYPTESPLRFLKELRALLRPEHAVLEVGAGAGALFPHGIRGTVRRVVGVDPDPRVLENKQLDEGFVGYGDRLPFSDETFDVAFHRMLAEHLEDPEATAAEIARVLRSGGKLVMHAPNRSHYTMIASRMTPMWFHRLYMRFLGTRRNAGDVHVAYYRFSCRRDVERICAKAGLTVERLEFWSAPPGYLRFGRLAFLLGVLYERLVERRFERARSTMFLVASKP
ncbi:MAG: class I SAM-dependent methyltransferase [Candidatus Methylomirabilis sp.]|nr:class I SAM-dependent methyltransferase [Deltaproteobacteria bacterium]